MSLDPSILSKAMSAYVRTFPTKDRLEKHLTDEGLDAERQEITKELDATLKTAEDYLYNYPGGVPWTKQFETEFEAMMRASHPWLDRAAMDRVLAFSRWFCWHEGLNSSLALAGIEHGMDWHFPMPMTIRCFKCGKVFEVAFTSEQRHEFPCPACGEVEVYDLGAMKEKALAAMSKKIRKSTRGKRFEL